MSNCPKCGEVVAQRAGPCPHCGTDMSARASALINRRVQIAKYTSAEQAEMNKANPERARVVAKQKKSTSSASGAAGAVLPSKNVTKAPSWYSTKVYTPDTAVTKGPKKGPAKKPAVAVKKTIATAPRTLGITPPTFRGPRN